MELHGERNRDFPLGYRPQVERNLPGFEHHPVGTLLGSLQDLGVIPTHWLVFEGPSTPTYGVPSLIFPGIMILDQSTKVSVFEVRETELQGCPKHKQDTRVRRFGCREEVRQPLTFFLLSVK